MPYKDPEKRRAYQREWVAKRRTEWFDANGPCVDCGTWGNTKNKLELDHEDPSTKIAHTIWSWAKERREKELKKCVIRCHSCHMNKTIQYGRVNKRRRILGHYTSQYVGVSWDSAAGKYRAYIYKDGKQYYLGKFNLEKEAAMAYQKAKEMLYPKEE